MKERKENSNSIGNIKNRNQFLQEITKYINDFRLVFVFLFSTNQISFRPHEN